MLLVGRSRLGAGTAAIRTSATYSEVFRALREVRPRAFLLENVRGLLRESFRPYFDYILDQLCEPFLAPKRGESWGRHKARLERGGSARGTASDRYVVHKLLVNAADYGLPQNRHRVLIVGFREDLGIEWTWPEMTDSRAALLWSQAKGSYWKEHGITDPGGLRARGEQPRLGRKPAELRWRTLRDAIEGLPEPMDGKEHPTIATRRHPRRSVVRGAHGQSPRLAR